MGAPSNGGAAGVASPQPSEERMRGHSLARQFAWLAPVAFAGALAGCNKEARRADTAAARVDTAGGTVARTDSAARADSMRTGDTANGGTRGGWSEGAIVAFANAANRGEVEEGQLAQKKATNPAVKAFAREMVADHRAMMSDVKSLASKLHITPDSTNDSVTGLMKDARDEMKDLTDKAAGADWDKDFIDKEIDGHQKVLDKLQDAAKNSNNAELRAGLEKATGKVQQHLTKAQDIKNNKLK
jgi:putative membrane protein